MMKKSIISVVLVVLFLCQGAFAETSFKSNEHPIKEVIDNLAGKQIIELLLQKFED